MCYKFISMQHFQHKKKASKQFFMGDGLLSHFQLQLCQKEPFWNIMGLLVTVSTGGFPPPFQTTIPTAPAFQPFGKFVLRVHHALSPAQWGPGHAGSTLPNQRPMPKPAAGFAHDSKGLLTREQILCLV